MPAAINLTESDLIVAVGDFLAAVLGPDTTILKTQANRVTIPKGDCVYMTPINMPGKSTTVTTYTDDATQSIRQDTKTIDWRVQLDFYGDYALEWANTIATVFRTEYATDLMKGYGVTPLYARDPHQTSMISSEDQWYTRWTLDIHLQPNIVITTPQQFADELNIGLVEVDGTYPPGA